jgi:predicted nucleic acid-binding protein
MKRATLADTGPLYALKDSSDQHHGRAQAELARLAKAPTVVFVPWPIVLEAYTLVLRRLGLPAGHGWLRELRQGSSLLNPTPEDYAAATTLMNRYQTSRSLCSMPPWPLSASGCDCRSGHMTTIWSSSAWKLGNRQKIHRAASKRPTCGGHPRVHW